LAGAEIRLFLWTSIPESCLPLVEDRRKLQHDLQRYRALLPFITDPQAIAAVENLIRETSERLDQLDPLHDQNGEPGC
jgi:hypothetical protein